MKIRACAPTKAKAGNVASNKNVLQAALQIHSVEARHASQVRRMRGNRGWIELNNGGNIPAAAQAVYNGEEATVQAGFNMATLFGAAAGSVSFDETLSGNDRRLIYRVVEITSDMTYINKW